MPPARLINWTANSRSSDKKDDGGTYQVHVPIFWFGHGSNQRKRINPIAADARGFTLIWIVLICGIAANNIF